LAMRANGTVYNGPSFNWNNALAMASGEFNEILLKRDGTIAEYPSTILPAGQSNIIDVAVSTFESVEFAVRSDGTVIGGNRVAVAPPGLANVSSLSAGSYHYVALLSDRDFPPVFLHTALNTTNFVTSSKASAAWFGQTNISHDGISAAQSAAIGNNASSSMRMWVAGPVQVSFWWKVSSATNHGVLSFSAAGNVLTNVSGEKDWQQVNVTVPPGNAILQWTYARDGSPAAGQDAGWVDQLQMTNVPPTIVVQPQPASQDVLGGTNITYSVTAFGTPPLNYSWRKDGITILFGSSTNLVLNNVTRSDSATYRVVITSPYGTASSSNAVLKVHVPQMLGAPLVEPDGSVLLVSADVDGSPLASSDLANLQVLVSTNLTDWEVMPNTLVLTNGAAQMQDSAATNSPIRFYRVLESW